jgi:glycolate oxidase
MAINKELYKALEDVLGPENISSDPAITFTNSQFRVTPRFAAVVLPKDTKEVQAIVRLCNKYKTPYKASSTHWLIFGDAGTPQTIKIDLRRMNRILEINEKNMYAVVEPYVIYAELQAEVMKRGLLCNITGAGANCSALPLAAHANLGQLSISCSWGERNQLGFEWVTPDGEIVRSGALESLDEWFCGDGPGPSLRGIIRGDQTPLGGLGVYTQAAQKLYHWPGPTAFATEGVSPYYSSQMPPNFMIGYYHCPSVQLQEDAMMKIGEAEIGFIVMGYNISMVLANMATSNIEERELASKWAPQVQGPGFIVAIAGNSAGDFEYKKMTLEKIVEKCQGKPLALFDDPKVAASFMYRYTRPTSSIRECFRYNGGPEGGGFAAGAISNSSDSYPLMNRFVQTLAPIKADYIKKGYLVEQSPHPPVMQIMENGHGGHCELLVQGIDTSSTEAINEIGKFNDVIQKTLVEGHFGTGYAAGNAEHDYFGPHTSNYHIWMRKVKKTFDPNAASDENFYISAGDQ